MNDERIAEIERRANRVKKLGPFRASAELGFLVNDASALVAELRREREKNEMLGATFQTRATSARRLSAAANHFSARSYWEGQHAAWLEAGIALEEVVDPFPVVDGVTAL